ncbi:MAG: A24 family peptidase C-terminal domain-containing protein [Metallosphaera sp.]|uniref:A24 family peptidase C-terminal domain-containing protein n=1 Tax=Metallosphaera sp. TaxID=2020860 RepID=UPI003162C70F
MLIHTSILDIKYREVDPKLWLFYSPLMIFLYFDIKMINLLIYIYSLFTVIIVFFAFYKLSFMGGADLFAVLIVSISNAVVHPLFFARLSELGIEPLVIVFYSSLFIIMSGIINLVSNFRHTKGLKFHTRLILAFSAKRIRVGQFINSKFLFPLTEIDDNGNEILRMGFSVEEDDSYWREVYKRLVNERKVSLDKYIWVAWGVPVLPFLLAGYIISLVIGLPFS